MRIERIIPTTFGMEFELLTKNKKMYKIVLLLAFVFVSTSAFSEVQDSIGTKKENGREFILHKIEKGETFYGICRKYNVKPSEAVKFNPSALEVIKTGEILKIPLPVPIIEDNVEEDVIIPDSAPPKQLIIKRTEKSYKNTFHTVVSGETLYSVSRKYGVSVLDIKKWNNLSSDGLSIGQKLIVKREEMNTVVGAEEDEVETIELDDNPVVEIIDDTDTDTDTEIVDIVDDVDNSTTDNYENLADGAEVEESGYVNFITDEEIDQDRNYVLHPKAKIGTIVMVTNPQNNKSIFVRVVGAYNVAEDENMDIIMKITKNTAKKIGLKQKDSMLVKINYAK
jgi:LysM repeat protein